MVTTSTRPRSPRHYLSYVREDLIGLWKVQAVSASTAPGKTRDSEYRWWNKLATEKRESLRAGRSETVWPWAFQLGRTPAARSLKRGDTLWIVTRPTGLGRNWPPALVAQMTLAEDVHLGPSSRKSRENLPFPYHFGVAAFSTPEGGRFFPANDATVALLEAGFSTPLDPVIDVRDVEETSAAHLEAWDSVSSSGFQSLRRIDDPASLVAFANRLADCSVFVSYRWDDHGEGGAEYNNLCEMAEELMTRCRLGVWLDRLTLPSSKHDAEERRKVIEKLLDSPLRDTPVLLARVTRTYAGLSGDPVRGVRYTLFEWERARQVIRWNREVCENEEHLQKALQKPVRILARDDSPIVIASAVKRSR